MHQYKNLDIDQLEELKSNYLIDSWSYSKVTTFARNEKVFEMQSIFGLYGRKSATTIAGSAYHHALDYYFTQRKEGNIIDLVEMEASAFDYIDNVDSNIWKIQKTTPTIEECQKKATAIVSALLRNFCSEISVYDIKEIIDVEISFEEYVTVNGVDIPLPCKGKIDMVVRTNEDKIAIIDHKSKPAFTPDEEAALSIGVQAITYVLAYEEKTGLQVDEVWFIENKHSQNKDKTNQLKSIPVEININTRRLYEALLYEPLRRMVSAVNDPDYVYLINDSDKLVDMAELYEFWARAQLSEIDDFNVDPQKKELIAKRLKKIKDASSVMITPQIIKNFKENAAAFITYDFSNKNMTPEEKIEHAMRSFGTIVKVAHKFEGYSSNTFLLEVAAGTRVASLYSKRLDLANALDVRNVRMSPEMVVYEEKSYMGVEISKKRDKDLIYDSSLREGKKIPIGVDNFGKVVYWDLNNHSTPHMLVCGATGSGKTISMKSTISYAKEAGIKNIIVFDPKFSKDLRFSGIPTINEIEEIEDYMAELVDHMNKLIREQREELTLVVLDEFADAFDNSRTSKQLGGLKTLEENLKMLAQKGRSCGIRIIIGTQRASIKVIKGDIKVNFPVRVCYSMPTEIDSKVVLDEAGAESLSGLGDGLMRSPVYPQTVRFQAFYKP